MALLSNRAVFFLFCSFHLALIVSPSLVFCHHLAQLIYFLSLFFEDVCVVCCLLQEKKRDVLCYFLSVRELAVTVHLTGFFHTPKLLQPVTKPGKLQAGTTRPGSSYLTQRLTLPF